MIPLDGGEARQLVSHDADISDYAWLGDGSRLAFRAQEKEPEERVNKSAEFP